MTSHENVSRIVFEDGGADHPGTPRGQLSLSLLGAEGRVELRQRKSELKGMMERVWTAALPPATWKHVVGTLTDCGFPTRPPPPETSDVPGDSHPTIGWTRDGQLETIGLNSNSKRYAPFTSVMWVIVARLAPQFTGGIPEGWFTSGTEIEGPVTELPPS